MLVAAPPLGVNADGVGGTVDADHDTVIAERIGVPLPRAVEGSVGQYLRAQTRGAAEPGEQ
jgi:hypothetical protein